PIPLKWINGPDRIASRIRGTNYRSGGYFLNITPEDNAIEFDRIAVIHLNGQPVFFGGELIGSVPLNRPVGLFQVDRLTNNLAAHSFRPDRLFHNLKEHPATDLDTIVTRYLKSLPKRRVDKLRASGQPVDARRRFDLCPITRAMIGRYQDWVKRI